MEPIAPRRHQLGQIRLVHGFLIPRLQPFNLHSGGGGFVVAEDGAELCTAAIGAFELFTKGATAEIHFYP